MPAAAGGYFKGSIKVLPGQAVNSPVLYGKQKVIAYLSRNKNYQSIEVRSMEKRRFSRVPFRIQAEITAGGQKFTGAVENLSLKGMYVKTEHAVDVGAPISIKIVLTGTQSNLMIDLKGKVVRQTDEGIGVYFDDMDLDSFIHLKNIVHYNSTDPEIIVNEFTRYLRDVAKGTDRGSS